MKTVRDRASLDERTIQKVARGEHVTPKRKRRVQSLNRSSEVHYLRLDDRVLAVLKEMRVDHRHVQVVSSIEVIVWNHSAPWPERKQ